MRQSVLALIQVLVLVLVVVSPAFAAGQESAIPATRQRVGEGPAGGTDEGPVVPDVPLHIEDVLCPLSPRGSEGCITQGFHAHHRGIDISLWGGTPISATHAGTVVCGGWVGGDFGNLIIVRSEGDPPEWESWYGHLDRVDVRQGDYVERGQWIGLSGDTGEKTTGAHLHYEIHHLGVAVDPLGLPAATPEPLTSNAMPWPAYTPTPAAVITGRVFDDRDRSTTQDPGEPGIAGVPVLLDGQVVEATDDSGRFSLPLAGLGRARLTVVPPEGWQWVGEPLIVEEARDGEVIIPLHRLEPVPVDPATTTATVTSSVIVAALLAGLALNGFASLSQAAAVRSLERTYRRQKSQELEQAFGRDLTARLEQLRGHLTGEPDAWREVVRQLLVDAGVGTDSTSIDEVEVSANSHPCFVVAGNGRHYLFTTDPSRLRKSRAIRWRDRVIALDTALSPFARVEAQALWDHLAQESRNGQTTLPRNVAWYLVGHKASDWRPRVRRKKRRRSRSG